MTAPWLCDNKEGFSKSLITFNPTCIRAQVCGLYKLRLSTMLFVLGSTFRHADPCQGCESVIPLMEILISECLLICSLLYLKSKLNSTSSRVFSVPGKLMNSVYLKVNKMFAPSAVGPRQLNRSVVGPRTSIILIKIKKLIARFKLAIQEVPAGYANEASQIIEEARIAGVYPELPPLTARDPRIEAGLKQPAAIKLAVR